MKDKPLTIGILAKTAKVNIETIRYYQRINLIAEPVKPAHGYRIYPDETLKRIQFIKRAQQLGFSLKEVEELLQLGEGHCDDVRQLAESKRDKIVQQINDLQNLETTLNELISCCKNSSSTSSCAIVEALSK
jgi:MerR family mercuric resistance operon transcriptional regulator